MRTIIVVVLFILFNCTVKPQGDSKELELKHNSSIVDSDTTYRFEEVDDERESISELEANDLKLLEGYRTVADSLISASIQGKSLKTCTPELLDELIELYNNNTLHCSKDNFVNSVGVALGDYLVQNLEMKWVVANDHYGRDYAIIGDFDVKNFPMSSVLKAVDQKLIGYMNGVYSVASKTKGDLTSKK